jgi:hypothetical protein
MRNTISSRGSFLVTKAMFFVSVCLLAVLSFFPSILDLIEETNHAEDLSIAHQLTEFILENRNPIFGTSYDTYDIRQLLAHSNVENLESFNYLEHNGLFYVNQLDRAVILPCENMTSDLSNIFESYGINYSYDDNISFYSPEEFLGKGIYYIPNEQSIISETIDYIRSYPQSQSSSYDSHIKNIDSLKSGLINRLFYSKPILQEIAISQSLLRFYDPTKTLWVDNNSWYTEATSSGTIHTILFEQGIENIPSFDLTSSIDFSQTKVSLDEVILPKTVKNIEYDAFPEAYFNINQLTIKSILDLYVQPSSVNGVRTFFRDIEFFKMDLMDLSEYVDFETNNDGEISFGLGEYSKVIADYGITAYKLEQLDDIVVVYLYSFDFLVAYATNAYVIDYYLGEHEEYPYVTRIQTDDTYVDPIEPEHPTREYLGWFGQEDNLMVSNQGILISRHTIFYSKES